MRAGSPPAARRRDLLASLRISGRPDRPGRPQRCRQDHADQGPGGVRRCRPPAASRTGAGRLPARRTPGPATSRSPPGIASCRPAAWTDRARAAAQPNGDGHPRRREAGHGHARYARLDAEFNAAGGYAAESEAASIAGALGLPDRGAGPAARDPLRWPAAPGRARRGSCSPAPRPAARRADQPPRRRLDRLAARPPQGLQGRAHRHLPRRGPARGGRQQGLPPRRQPAELDIYNLGWKPTSSQRETDERRRKRERRQRREEGRPPCWPRPTRCGAKATKATAAQNMARRAERLLAGSRDRAGARQGGQAALPRAPRRAARPRCGQTAGCRGPTARWRSSPTSTWPSTAAHGSSCSGSTVPARRPCCACSPASTPPTRGRSSRGTGSRSATTPRSTRTSTSSGRCWRT
jgi:hypothetical protein